MCPSPKSNNGAIQEQQQQEADLARQRETERQTKVDAGVAGIRGAFARYDDSYFDKLRGSFVDTNRDTLTQQQNKEAEEAAYGAARAGLTNSSAGNRQRAELAAGFAKQNNALEQGAEDFAQGQKGELAGAQQTLEAQARSSADAEGATQAATTQTGTIARTAPVTAGSWLAPALGSAIGGYNAYNSGKEGGFYRARAAQLFGSGGSGNVVN